LTSTCTPFVRRRGKIDFPRFTELLVKGVDPTRLSLPSAVQENLENIQLAMANAVTTKSKKGSSSKPWFDRECRALKHVALQALHLAKEHDMMRPLYCGYRRNFKRVCSEKRARYAADMERKLVYEAEEAPYKYLGRGAPPSNPIPMCVWVDHFRALLSERDMTPMGGGIIRHP
jgi:hypothetical protein